MRPFVHGIAYIAIFLLFLLPAAAQDGTTLLSILLKDVESNNLIVPLPAVISGRNINTANELRATDYVTPQGTLQLRLEPGNWELQIRLYNTTKGEVEYYTERAVYIQAGEPNLRKTFYLAPVGSVEGIVQNKEGNVIGNAELEFRCDSKERIAYPRRTDKFGFFRADVVPAGKCKVFAAQSDRVGVTEVGVKRGERSTAQIALATGFSPTKKSYILIGGSIGVVLIVLVVVLVHLRILQRKIASLRNARAERRQRTQVKQAKATPASSAPISSASPILTPAHQPAASSPQPNQPNEGQEKEMNPRARDIMKTLNEKEKKVMQHLWESKEYHSTQATIRNITGIPKTTLVRVFQSLEGKKVMTVEKIGRMKKVRLTPWFLGKE